jgi:RNA polymerase sigma factor (sigma-70 family)
MNPREGRAAAWDRDGDLGRAGRAAGGDQAELRALVSELKGGVWSRAWALARPDHHRAEDLAQEALVAALRPAALRQYAGAAPLRGYLLVIAQRRMIAIVRTAREQAWATRAALVDEAASAADDDDPTFDAVDRGASADRVVRAIETLPPDTAMLVRLKAAGAPNEEVAALLEIPVGTVKSRFNRACHRLRIALEGAQA